MCIRQQDYLATKPGVLDKIEQLLIEKQKWIDEQLGKFYIFDRTTDRIKLIHDQAAERYDEQIKSLYKLYNEL